MSIKTKTPENPKTDARCGFGQSTRRSFLSRLGMASLLASAGPAFGERARAEPAATRKRKKQCLR